MKIRTGFVSNSSSSSFVIFSKEADWEFIKQKSKIYKDNPDLQLILDTLVQDHELDSDLDSGKFVVVQTTISTDDSYSEILDIVSPNNDMCCGDLWEYSQEVHNAFEKFCEEVQTKFKNKAIVLIERE